MPHSGRQSSSRTRHRYYPAFWPLINQRSPNCSHPCICARNLKVDRLWVVRRTVRLRRTAFPLAHQRLLVLYTIVTRICSHPVAIGTLHFGPSRIPHHFSPFQGFLVLAPVSVPLVDRRLRHLLTLRPHCSSTRTCRFRHGGRCTVRATTTLPHLCVRLLRQLHLPSFSRRPPILSASTAATPLSTRLTQQLGGGCAAQPVHLQPMHRLGGG